MALLSDAVVRQQGCLRPRITVPSLEVDIFLNKMKKKIRKVLQTDGGGWVDGSEERTSRRGENVLAW